MKEKEMWRNEMVQNDCKLWKTINFIREKSIIDHIDE